MKKTFEQDDLVYYEGEPVTVLGPPVKANGVPGHHVRDKKGGIHLVPSTVLVTPEAHWLDRCVKLLLGHEQWEADLTSSDEDSLLEEMTPENYEALSVLQEQRKEVLSEIVALHKAQTLKKN